MAGRIAGAPARGAASAIREARNPGLADPDRQRQSEPLTSRLLSHLQPLAVPGRYGRRGGNVADFSDCGRARGVGG